MLEINPLNQKLKDIICGLGVDLNVFVVIGPLHKANLLLLHGLDFFLPHGSTKHIRTT